MLTTIGAWLIAIGFGILFMWLVVLPVGYRLLLWLLDMLEEEHHD